MAKAPIFSAGGYFFMKQLPPKAVEIYRWTATRKPSIRPQVSIVSNAHTNESGLGTPKKEQVITFRGITTKTITYDAYCRSPHIADGHA